MIYYFTISQMRKYFGFESTNILFLRRKIAVLKHPHKFSLNFYSRAIGVNGVSSNSQFAPRCIRNKK